MDTALCNAIPILYIARKSDLGHQEEKDNRFDRVALPHRFKAQFKNLLKKRCEGMLIHRGDRNSLVIRVASLNTILSREWKQFCEE